MASGGRKRRIPLPSQDELKRIFTYNPRTGDLMWSISASGTARKGHIIDSDKGNRQVQYKGVRYIITRVIWKMVYNEEPIEIDHRDLNKSNNRLDNLRAATSGENHRNRPASRVNKLGVKGVYQTKYGKYHAQLRMPSVVGSGSGKQIHLGIFTTLEEARAAYAAASAKYHGEFGRAG